MPISNAKASSSTKAKDKTAASLRCGSDHLHPDGHARFGKPAGQKRAGMETSVTA